MRMWLGVGPSEMCRKHLLGEHVELHMLAGCLIKGKNQASVKGLIRDGFIFPSYALSRHTDIIEEMKARGYNHRSPYFMYFWDEWPGMTYEEWCNKPNTERNRLELAARCPECAAKMKKEEGNETV